MSLFLLDVVPCDVTADALGLLINAATPVPLAELRIADGHGAVATLGVLGASHVITATVPGHRLTEQVSCDAIDAGGQPLPNSQHEDGYEFTASTTALPRAELEAIAVRLRGLSAQGDRWICGAFPGDEAALTALTAHRLADVGWTWQTWHIYPGRDTGVIVKTQSRWRP